MSRNVEKPMLCILTKNQAVQLLEMARVEAGNFEMQTSKLLKSKVFVT